MASRERSTLDAARPQNVANWLSNARGACNNLQASRQNAPCYIGQGAG
eukprot:CAMPEP_0198552836 /NCGR_PEP_ID=MMETSP1462-20131121/79346_1 /TAXON_ID=1333877 /ORGANISM="Brandtodinium nutriculum, Strain RCC3387" /LENGTH=47 /DNA_ID= /DNA_START= /DNA_END= /DNA_ORIENTATION=